MGLFVITAGLVAGALMLMVAQLRMRRSDPSVREGVPRSCISELSAGRYRVIGKVVPTLTATSQLDGAECVFLEQASYSVVGHRAVPLLREVARELEAHPFHIDDGTGLLLIDPKTVEFDAPVIEDDDATIVERRIRAGEEIELVATFAESEHVSSGGPYRARVPFAPVDDEVCGPPVVSYRTLETMIHHVDDLTGFLRGAGIAAILMTAGFALVLFVPF